jgi:hypothetical protein
VSGGWSEHRLLIAIGVAAATVGTYEVLNPSDEDLVAREHRASGVLAEVYPAEPRVQYELGMDRMNAGEIERAAEIFEAVYDSGFKEDERFYSAYVDVLVLTGGEPARIRSVVERWRRDYPTSGRRGRMEARLRDAGILP